MKKYDLIIIGSGGGTKLRPAAELGLKVAIIEKDSLGGTCLNRGCIPSKMLIHAAELNDELNEYTKHDFKANPKAKINFTALTKRVTTSVSKTSKQIAQAYKQNPNVDYYKGTATFKSNKIVKVGNNELTAKRIFIAVGTRPFIPEIPGLEGTPYMTSTEALRRPKQPKSLIVIGGGYIATELGYFYGALGTKTTFLVRSKFLKNEDPEIIGEFTKEFTKKFDTHLGFTATSVQYKKGKFTVTACNREGEIVKVQAEALLVATGIQSNADTLKLENTDVQVDDHGYIVTNDHLQTTVKDIYALGDVNGRYFFRHSVNFEGEYLLNALYTEPHTQKIKYPAVPHAVFTNPQIAGVGPTESELEEQSIPYYVGKNAYKDSAMGGDALQMDHGFVKLLFHAKTDRLLAAHIIGPQASNMIHMLIAFINMKAKLQDLLNTIYIHPALPEIVRNAARKALSHKAQHTS